MVVIRQDRAVNVVNVMHPQRPLQQAVPVVLVMKGNPLQSLVGNKMFINCVVTFHLLIKVQRRHKPCVNCWRYRNRTKHDHTNHDNRHCRLA